jgi:hypothetical protein
MPKASVPRPTVPYGADQTLFVVIDRLDKATEIRVERSDLEATIGELVAGCFNDPIRVISFNTLEHWMKDISTEIAGEIQARCDIDGVTLPDYLSDFVESHTRSRITASSRMAQMTLNEGRGSAPCGEGECAQSL